jgi:hypothetical protein
MLPIIFFQMDIYVHTIIDLFDSADKDILFTILFLEKNRRQYHREKETKITGRE